MANTLSADNRSISKNPTAWNMRLYREGDIPALVALTEACAAVDSFDKHLSEEEMAASLAQPLSDPPRQIIIVDGPPQAGVAEGVPLAMARALSFDDADAGQRLYQMRIRIHPAVRGTGIETALASRLIDHIRANETEGGLPPRDNVQMLAVAREEDKVSRATYESMGLLTARYSWTMERSLNEPIPAPKEVEGVHVRNYRRPEDDEGALTAYNNSFIDHFEFHAMPQEMWTYVMSRPEARPDLSWLAEVEEGPDAGSLAGFCICEINEHDNARTGNKEGWIGLLGTIRGWRGVGLGKSLLLRGMHSLKEADLETALLGVDSESPTGANRLYESVGFTIRNHEILYKCSLSEARL